MVSRSNWLNVVFGTSAMLLAWLMGLRLERIISASSNALKTVSLSVEPRAMLQSGLIGNSIGDPSLVALPLNQWLVDSDGRYIYRTSLFSSFNLERVEGKLILDWGSFVEIGLAEDSNGYYLIRLEPNRVCLYFSVMGTDRVLMSELVPDQPVSAARFQIQVAPDRVTFVQGAVEHDLLHGFNLTKGKVSVLTNLNSREIAYLNVIPTLEEHHD